jgi:hypothetical protein
MILQSLIETKMKLDLFNRIGAIIYSILYFVDSTKASFADYSSCLKLFLESPCF